MPKSCELAGQILCPFNMRTEQHGGNICLKSTLTRQLGCHPVLQTPSESRTLPLKSGISNSVVVNFQGGESPNFFEDLKFLSGRMWRGRSPGKDDRDVPGREQRSEGSCGRSLERKPKCGAWSHWEGQKRRCSPFPDTSCQPQEEEVGAHNGNEGPWPWLVTQRSPGS